MTTNGAVIETRALRKNYESESAPVRALRGIDLEVRGGEFIAVMGPSGCGKSTLLNIIAGLDTPSDGDVRIAGESLVGKDENALAHMRREHIGIVFQFFNLLEGMTALENVALPAIVAGSPRRRAEARARVARQRSDDAPHRLRDLLHAGRHQYVPAAGVSGALRRGEQHHGASSRSAEPAAGVHRR